MWVELLAAMMVHLMDDYLESYSAGMMEMLLVGKWVVDWADY